MKNKMKVLFVSSEVEPFAKSGGLGDVVGSLPHYLNDLNIDTRVLMPLYSKISSTYREKMKFLGFIFIDLNWRHQYCGIFSYVLNGVTYYFADNEYYFKSDTIYNDNDLERFSFLSMAAFEICKFINFKVDIIHSNDWHVASIGALYEDYYRYDKFFSKTRNVFTIHNLAYQGIYDKDKVLDILPLNRDKYKDTFTINMLALGIIYASRVTTVSKTYANEILTSEFGEKLDPLLNHEKDKLVGILNGVDEKMYNPSLDTFIYKNYSLDEVFEGKKENKKNLCESLGFKYDDDIPLIGIVSRLASQKGMNLVLNVINRLLEKDVNIVLLGSGDPILENSFRQINNPKFKAILKFDNALAHKIYASSDLFLMPSAFEPCGLAQMICLRYGTIPLVRATGGLKDSIIPFNEYTLEGNGFTFDNFNSHDFYNTIVYALSVYKRKELWNKLVLNGKNYDFSWQNSAILYKLLYESIIRSR